MLTCALAAGVETLAHNDVMHIPWHPDRTTLRNKDNDDW